MNSSIELRRSIRKYNPGIAVTRDLLDQLVHAAMLAPSACNSRPWEFVVVTKREILDEIVRIHPYTQMLRTATAAIIVVATPQSGMPEGYYPQDCAAATENILIEATELGLGACWCGVYPKEDRMASISALLDIPAPKIPFNVIAVGVPAEAPAARGFFDAAKVRYVD